MSLTFSRYVRVIFHVCPVLSLRVFSLHLPSCRLVPLRFVSLSFPLHSFSFLSLSCPFQFPFVSLSFPVAFLTCGLPISSPHFLALPCISLCSPVIPAKKHGFPAFSQRGRPQTQSFSRFFLAFPLGSPAFPTKTRFFQRLRKEDIQKQSFSRFSAKACRKPKPAKSRLGESSLGRLRLVERHQITARYVGERGGGEEGRGGRNPAYLTCLGGTKGGLSSILSQVSDTPNNVGGFSLGQHRRLSEAPPRNQYLPPEKTTRPLRRRRLCAWPDLRWRDRRRPSFRLPGSWGFSVWRGWMDGSYSFVSSSVFGFPFLEFIGKCHLFSQGQVWSMVALDPWLLADPAFVSDPIQGPGISGMKGPFCGMTIREITKKDDFSRCTRKVTRDHLGTRNIYRSTSICCLLALGP